MQLKLSVISQFDGLLSREVQFGYEACKYQQILDLFAISSLVRVIRDSSSK